MRRGRKPIPNRLKILSGSDRRHPERMNLSEPKAPPASLDPPHGLSKLEKFHWNRISPILHDAGLLTRLDTAMLQSLVRHLAIADQCAALIHKKGILWRQGKQVATSPAISIQRNALQAAQRILVEFGMSPSSRSRINMDVLEPSEPFVVRDPIVDQEAEDKIDEAFFGKRTPGA